MKIFCLTSEGASNQINICLASFEHFHLCCVNLSYNTFTQVLNLSKLRDTTCGSFQVKVNGYCVFIVLLPKYY